MLLRVVLALPFSTLKGNANFGHGDYDSSSSFSGLGLYAKNFSSNFNLSSRKGKQFVASASKEQEPLENVVFRPFEEVQKDSLLVPLDPQLSIARQGFSNVCEAAINEQINVEYNVSYVYHAMFAYFDRDNIALKGLAKFFRKSSEEEREHAEKLIRYQNIRGGKVKLHSILLSISEFDHEEKGDALYAMELALALEKLTNEKLLSLHKVAETKNDAQMVDFIESEFLGEQVESIKKIAEYVAQLRLVGKGHGVWHFDQKLLHDDDAA